MFRWFIVCFLVLFTQPVAAGRQSCRLNYLAFDTEHLQCLKNNIAVKSIAVNLKEIAATKRTCPKCVEAFPGASSFSHLLVRGYLALAMEQNGFGGYTISVVFQNDPHIFRLWLYPIESETFQIRNMSVDKFSKKDTKLTGQYAKESKYAKYWFPPVDFSPRKIPAKTQKNMGKASMPINQGATSTRARASTADVMPFRQLQAVEIYSGLLPVQYSPIPSLARVHR